MYVGRHQKVDVGKTEYTTTKYTGVSEVRVWDLPITRAVIRTKQVHTALEFTSLSGSSQEQLGTARDASTMIERNGMVDDDWSNHHQSVGFGKWHLGIPLHTGLTRRPIRSQ